MMWKIIGLVCWLGCVWGEGYWEQEERIVVEWLGRLKGNERILHVGCGDRRLTRVLEGLVPDGVVVGIDRECRERSVREMGWREEFDFVVCTQSVEWEERPEEVFGAVLGALRDGGWFLSVLCVRESLPAANPLWKWLKEGAMGYADYLRVGRDISYQEFRELIRSAGFREAGSTRVRMVAEYRDVEVFKREIGRWFFHDLQWLEEREACLEEMVSCVSKTKGVRFFYALEIGWGVK